MPTIETHICFITETLSMVTAKQLLQRDAHVVGSRLLGSGTCLNMIAASMHHRSELIGKHGLVAKCSCETPSGDQRHHCTILRCSPIQFRMQVLQSS